VKSAYKKFAKDTLVIGVARALVELRSVILLPLLTKTLGTHDYGIWAQVQVTISLVLGFVGLGLPYAMSRFLPTKTSKEEIQDEFWSAFCLVSIATFVVSIVLIAVPSPISKAFFEGATEIVRVTGLIILVWSLDTAILSLYRAFRHMKRYALFIVLDSYAQVGLIAFLALRGSGLFSVIASVLAVRAAILLCLVIQVSRQIGIRKPTFSKIKEYLNFGLPTVPGNVAAWAVASSDRYAIGYFLGAASVGIYSAAYGLGSLMIMVAAIVGFVLPPTLSKLYDEKRVNELSRHLIYSFKYLLMINIPFVVGAAFLGKPILRLFSTSEIAWKGHYVVPIVALSILFYSAYVVIAQVLVVAKRTKILGLVWIISALLNLGLNLVVVPRLGILGAAFTTLFAYALALGIGTYYSFKEFKFSIDWGSIGKSIIASGAMAAVLWPMRAQTVLSTVGTVGAGVIVYAGTLFLLKGVTRREIEFFRDLFQHSADTVVLNKNGPK